MRGAVRQDEAMIRCPYFRGHTKNEIGCEGITEKCVIRLMFMNRQDMQEHERMYCMGIDSCRYCELYRAIDEQYGGDD